MKDFRFGMFIILLIFILIGFGLDSYCGFTKTGLDKISYYGTIITIYSLWHMFWSISRTKTLQEEIKQEIVHLNNQTSLQINPIFQQYLSSLKQNLQNEEFTLAQKDVMFIKGFLPYHVKYNEIMEKINHEIKSNKVHFLNPPQIDCFFPHLETELGKLISRNRRRERDKKDFLQDSAIYIAILNKIDTYLSNHTGE